MIAGDESPGNEGQALDATTGTAYFANMVSLTALNSQHKKY